MQKYLENPGTGNDKNRKYPEPWILIVNYFKYQNVKAKHCYISQMQYKNPYLSLLGKTPLFLTSVVWSLLPSSTTITS